MMQTLEDPSAGTMPARPGADAWPHALAYSHEGELTVAVADTAGELLSLVIPDYPATDADESDIAAVEAVRIDYGLAVARQVQVSLMAQALERGRVVEEDLDEPLLNSLLAAKDTSLALEGDWEHEVPLVVLDMAYAPFTDTPRPQGRVVWVDVHSETDLLASLDRIGVVRWFREVA